MVTREILQQLAARLQKAFPGQLAAVILFGSRAAGTAHAGSDYDFLILTNRKLSAQEEAQWAAVCYEIDVAYGICTDLHFLSVAEANGLRGAQPVFQDALKNGLKAA